VDLDYGRMRLYRKSNVYFTLVGGISQMVPLGSLTQRFVFKLQQVTPAQSVVVVNVNFDYTD
jgi:hypothetical protein